MTEPAPAPPAALASMTGFARRDGSAEGAAWVWEARSVNGKSLELRCRLPAGFERLEQAARAEAAKRFRRGNVTLNLTVTRSEAAPQIRINRAVLDQILALALELEAVGAAPPRIDGLLAVRGVVETIDTTADTAALEGQAATSLSWLLDDLAKARAEEGARLALVLGGQLGRIEALVGAAAGTAAAQPEALKARLRAQVEALLEASSSLSEDRLAQEAALLGSRADVREELDRLTAHVAQAQGLLAEGNGVGRRLDFLCQELNREANTLCSKSTDVALTRLGLDLKVAIEQFREQVQNIE